MNATQKKYIVKRIDETVSSKVKEVTKGKVTIYNDRFNRGERNISVSCQPLTDAEMNKAIKLAGGIKVLSSTDVKTQVLKNIKDGYGVRMNCNPLKNYKEINLEIQKISDAKTADIHALAMKIVARGEELKDEVYLGDEEKAMELLKAFRAEKF